jgi:hypothetical protein
VEPGICSTHLGGDSSSTSEIIFRRPEMGVCA